MLGKRDLAEMNQGDNARQRAVWGALGGLLPTLVTVPGADLGVGQEIVGILVRLVVMALVGAIVVAAHSDETKPFRLLELGIAAPAIISLFLAGYSGEGSETAQPAGIVVAARAEGPEYTDDRAEAEVRETVERLSGSEINPDSVQVVLREKLGDGVVVFTNRDTSEVRARQEQLDRQGYTTAAIVLPQGEEAGREAFLDGLLIRQ